MGLVKDFADTVRVLFWMFVDPFSQLLRCLLPKGAKSVKGEVVLLTGAGHGLGKEIALRMASLGAIMVLWDINQEGNEAVAAEVRSRGGVAHAFRVDVTREEDVAAAAQLVRRDVGEVGVLVSNAGVFSGRPLLQLPPNVIRRCFDVNAIAHFWMLQQFLPHMMEKNKGHVVAVVSIAGHQGVPNMTDYCASKHAAAGLMSSLYNELSALGKRGVRLTTINPVIITTGLIENVKSRFPCLLPLMSVEKTADSVVRAILHEEGDVFLPTRARYLVAMTRCFSRRTRYRILEYVNYGFDPDPHPPQVV